MLLRYHGIRRSETELAKLCRLDPVSGVNPEALLEAAERFGLRAEARIASLQTLQALTAQQIYPIVLLISQEQGLMTTMHAVVVRKVYRQKIRVYDPLIGKVTVAIADFQRRWTARGNWLILVRE
jgi:ABC-type bacteriocin/lantibiotic exporter with double-glycine peptidase domain